MRMKPTNVRKKIKGTTECDKSIVTCDVGTTQYKDGSIKSEGKKKRTTKCDKSTVKSNIGTIQCENGTVKCEKKIMEPSNVKK